MHTHTYTTYIYIWSYTPHTYTLYTFTSNINLHMHIQLTSFKLTPFLAVMVNPTGSIVGPGNTSLFNGDIQDALVCHAIVHDAFGYLHNLHKAGPGYNYLNVCDIIPSSSPLSCQVQGFAAADKIGKHSGMIDRNGRIRRLLFTSLMKGIPAIQTHAAKEQQESSLRKIGNAFSISGEAVGVSSAASTASPTSAETTDSPVILVEDFPSI